MTRPRLKTISDTVLADTLLRMRDDFAYWDLEPSVYRHTKKDHEALGAKMAKGAGEVVRRVEEDGLEAHAPLSRIFKAVSKLKDKRRRNGWAIYNAMRNIHRKKEPTGYAF